MVKNNRLAPILNQYKELEVGPDKLPPLEMGYVYEELLRRFSEQSGEEAGEHFTPREVIRLMVELLDIPIPDRHISIYDPACGTGGMLSAAKEHLLDHDGTDQQKAKVEGFATVHGQELSPTTTPSAPGSGTTVVDGQFPCPKPPARPLAEFLLDPIPRPESQCEMPVLQRSFQLPLLRRWGRGNVRELRQCQDASLL